MNLDESTDTNDTRSTDTNDKRSMDTSDKPMDTNDYRSMDTSETTMSSVTQVKNAHCFQKEKQQVYSPSRQETHTELYYLPGLALAHGLAHGLPQIKKN